MTDSPAFLYFERHLFPPASQGFLKVRATLFVGPEDFSVTSHKVRLPRIVIESTPPAGRVSPRPGEVLIRDLWLQKIVPLSQFLSAIERTLEHKTVIITAGREARWLLRPPHVEHLRQLGLQRIDDWKRSPADVSYAAVIKDGRLVFERAGNAELIYQDKRLRVYSGNSKFQILVDGVDYAQSQDGLNIVVVDGDELLVEQ
jgi:hypothetical protein